jgi:hypothetical protein
MNEMNITSAKYMLHHLTNENISISAIIEGKTLVIPLDPANRHYAEILRQVESGTLTIADADPLPDAE